MTRGYQSIPVSARQQGSAAVCVQHSCQCMDFRCKQSFLESTYAKYLLNRDGTPVGLANIAQNPISSLVFEFPDSLALVYIT